MSEINIIEYVFHNIMLIILFGVSFFIHKDINISMLVLLIVSQAYLMAKS